MPRAFVRTPQACDACRRRKSKCDGIRPRCRRCTSRSITCVWSTPDNAHEPRAAVPEPIDHVETVVDTTSDGLRACLRLFFDRHFASDFCSFDHRPDFEQKCMQSSLLSSSVIALCGRYLSPQDAQALFRLPTGSAVSDHYLLKARSLAKESSDQPTLSHIQGNIVLAQAELLSSSGSRHWLFAGIAIRMAEIMRLNKNFHQKHSLKEQEIRRRTLWACLLFDRALAYFLAKHRTIDIENVGIPVPGTDASLIYQEETRGVSLSHLASYQRPSDLGLSPYLIQTVCLWSDLADFTVYSRRNLDKFAPNDPKSLLYIRYDALQTWINALHPSLGWSSSNFRDQCTLSMGKPFVAMHFLLGSAACVAHQCYLPHLAMYTQLCDLVDGAGWSYLHREPSLIEICVSNALRVGEMLSFLMDQDHGKEMHRASLQTIWVASSVLIVANTFLWVQYAQDESFSGNEVQHKAKTYFQLIEQLVSSWVPEWKAAKQWLMALNVMHSLYKAAYLGEIHENMLSPSSAHPDDNAADDFRPQPGDGYPSLISLPHLQASIKFATGDTSAKFIDIQSIWLQLSGGWPYGFTAPACMVASAEAQVDYAVPDSSEQVRL
ncbi:zinc finger transcription factor 1 [Fusarium albosuccineum]|uniref:Zinc finger transcription factor 1 n=1 Tax=Fusarium albosuccineum TaxID=1237068 RepID=A0A8H4LAE6_9HYPO|nr:zinc finger transcription factor 1 [Fusarium albosuccineum]